MIYIIIDSADDCGSMLVRAENEEYLKARLRFTDTQKIVARWSDNEVKALTSSVFAVVTG